jgi:arginyl-tRNA synthetase
MFTQKLKQQIVEAAHQATGEKFDAERFDVMISSDSSFGDYASNVAMVYAKELKLPPRQLAAKLVEEIAQLKGVERAEVAGPGFINITLTDKALMALAAGAVASRPRVYAGQEVVTEYSDPNPFKVLHAGHLYTTIVGDSISRLFEAGGGHVHRVNYGGDVGLHVGRAMWGIVRQLGGEHPEELAKVPKDERAVWISQRYVEGNTAYENDPEAREQIIAYNKRVYALHEAGDYESPFAKIYWTCREWSYDGFRRLYERLGIVEFERYLPESEVTPLALELVDRGRDKGVFEKSDGALVFKGEGGGLHTRVFLTAAGLPTYEAKDLGLAAIKWRDYHFDRSVIITGNDIVDYMKVVLAALAHFYPEVVPRTTHLTHGMVKLPGGVKMSSRKGNTLLARDILDAAASANLAATGKDDWRVVVGAVKYAFLKQGIGGDIIYSPDESVSLEGNSGPYLQYAHARARSILAKAAGVSSSGRLEDTFVDGERSLVRKTAEYSGVVDRAVNDLAPHGIATYLYELAQVFNRFYEANRVIGDEREATRVNLVTVYADILRDGLRLLGIAAPDRL